MRIETSMGVFLLTALLTASAAGDPSEGIAPSSRLAVAVTWFGDQPGNPQNACWCYTFRRLVTTSLADVKAIRILPRDAVEYAYRRMKTDAGTPLNMTQARELGELTEAQRVIYGRYARQGDQWKITTVVLNVATGEATDEIQVASTNWFQARDETIAAVLKILRVTPSPREQPSVARCWTASDDALTLYSHVYALSVAGEHFSEGENLAREAIAKDNQFEEAHVALAAMLGSQGKFGEAETEVRHALKLRPDDPKAHQILAIAQFFQERFPEAQQELQIAEDLYPDDSENLYRLGEIAVAQNKWDEAIADWEQAMHLDKTDARLYAQLGRAYAHKGNREKAMTALGEADCIDSQNVTVQKFLCQTYDSLGETLEAVNHYEQCIALARRTEGLSDVAGIFQNRANELERRLTPTCISVSAPPHSYSDDTLAVALRKRLTASQLAMVVNPLESSQTIKQWAQQLTVRAKDDEARARALFEALTARISTHNAPGEHRTAGEVFTLWKDEGVDFDCDEYANLFIAMARDAGLQAFYVDVQRDYRDEPVYHACAAVFLANKTILVDPAYRWFGIPHRKFVILDDVQAIAIHLTQTASSVPKLRIGAKLYPDSFFVQANLALELVKEGNLDEAKRLCRQLDARRPGDPLVYRIWGSIALRTRQYDDAVNDLRKTVSLMRSDHIGHIELAIALMQDGQLKEAREEFRTYLDYDGASQYADHARLAIAQINEQIGAD